MATGATISVGSFRLIGAIGRGAMGEVWSAVHALGKEATAVKIVTRQLALQRGYHEVFQREVHAAAALNHRNIVRLFDYGVIDERAERASSGSLVKGGPWLAMELADGALPGFLPGSWVDLREVLLQILAGLAHAHARGVIHRDLKPANVLATRAEGGIRFQLADFGIAHVLFEDAESRSRRAPGGTPLYMSPEQIETQWQSYGPWTDLYSLGCLAFELASGRPPFVSRFVEELVAAHLLQQPPDLVARFPVPEGLSEWVHCLLNKAPRERFQCAADASQALRALGMEVTGKQEQVPVEPTTDASLSASSQMADTGARTWIHQDTVVDPAHTRPGLPGGRAPSPPADEPDPARTRRGVPTSATRAADRNTGGARTPSPAITSRAPSPPAPVPADWTDDAPAPPAISAGLGLFGIRRIPFIGRERERDLLWFTLRRLHEVPDILVTLLRGQAGVGASALARWYVERAVELGAARSLRATHDAVDGPMHGLGRMIADAVGGIGLPRLGLFQRVQDSIVGHTGERRRMLAAAITEIVDPAPGPNAEDGVPPIRFAKPAERYAALVDWTLDWARQRPVIVWLDDLQWGPDALGYLDALLKTEASASIHAVGTLQDELLVERPVTRRWIAEVRTSSRVSEIALKPMERAESLALIRSLVSVEDEVAALVHDRCEGRPLFSIQVLGDWIEAHLLRTDDSGEVRLSSAARDRVPANVLALWEERIQALYRARGAEATQWQQLLELAAALGSSVDTDELKAATEALEVKLPEGFLEELLRRNLAEHVEGGWRFAQGLLRDVIRRQSRDQGRWQALNRTCARMFSRRPELDALERCASHYAEAGDHELAIDTWLEALPARHGRVDLAQREVVLDRLDASIAAVPLPADDERRGKAACWRARTLRVAGRFDEALTAATDAIDIGEQGGWARLVAEGKELLGEVIVASSSEPESALQAYGEALRLFESLGDTAGIASVRSNMAFVHLFRAELSEAAEHCEAACDGFRRLGDDRFGQSLYYLGLIHSRTEEHQSRARAELEEVLTLSSELGHRYTHACALNGLANLDRQQGDLDKARQRYDEVVAILAEIQIANDVPRLNLALVDFLRGNIRAASDQLQALLASLPATGPTKLRGFGAAVLMACAARMRLVDEFDEHLATLLDVIARTQLISADVALPARMAADDLADELPERALRAYDVALEQYRALGSATEAAEVFQARARVISD